MITVCIPTVPKREQRLQVCLDALKQNTPEKHELLVYTNNDGGWVKACRNMLKDLKDRFVIILGDDAIPQKDWLKNLESATLNHDSLFCVNDLVFKDSVAVFPAGPASYIRKYLYAGYNHYGADSELTQIAKAQDRFVWVPDSIIHHHHFVHPSTSSAPLDDVYAECWSQYKRKDERLFRERCKASDKFKNLKGIPLNVD